MSDVAVLWVDVKTARRIFSVGRNLLEEWVTSGKVRRRKPRARKVLYNARDIDRVIEESEG